VILLKYDNRERSSRSLLGIPLMFELCVAAYLRSRKLPALTSTEKDAIPWLYGTLPTSTESSLRARNDGGAGMQGRRRKRNRVEQPISVGEPPGLVAVRLSTS